MQKIVNGILIEYEKQDENLSQKIVEDLTKKSKEIMAFFELKEIKDFKIKIWSNYDEFKSFLMPYLKEKGEEDCISWITANTDDGNINMLPARIINCEIKKPEQEKTNDENIAILACHELVHICQQNCLGGEECQNFWLWEALATNLGNSEHFAWVEKEYDKYIHFDEIKNIDSLTEVMNTGNYKYVYLVGKYILSNKSQNEILKYVKQPKYCEEKGEDILAETKIYSQKTFSKNNELECEMCCEK